MILYLYGTIGTVVCKVILARRNGNLDKSADVTLSFVADARRIFSTFVQCCGSRPFDTDTDPGPDPAFHFDTDPDPAFQFDTEPNPTV